MSRSWNKNAPIFTLDSKENGGNHRPMAAAAGTVGKWGQMGFTSIRNSYAGQNYPSSAQSPSSVNVRSSLDYDPSSATSPTAAPSSAPKPKKFFKSRNTAQQQPLDHQKSPPQHQTQLYEGQSLYPAGFYGAQASNQQVASKSGESSKPAKGKRGRPKKKPVQPEEVVISEVPSQPVELAVGHESEMGTGKRRSRKVVNYNEIDDVTIQPAPISYVETVALPPPPSPPLADHPPIVLRISKGTSRLVSTDSEAENNSSPTYHPKSPDYNRPATIPVNYPSTDQIQSNAEEEGDGDDEEEDLSSTVNRHIETPPVKQFSPVKIKIKVAEERPIAIAPKLRQKRQRKEVARIKSRAPLPSESGSESGGRTTRAQTQKKEIEDLERSIQEQPRSPEPGSENYELYRTLASSPSPEKEPEISSPQKPVEIVQKQNVIENALVKPLPKPRGRPPKNKVPVVVPAEVKVVEKVIEEPVKEVIPEVIKPLPKKRGRKPKAAIAATAIETKQTQEEGVKVEASPVISNQPVEDSPSKRRRSQRAGPSPGSAEKAVTPSATQPSTSKQRTPTKMSVDPIEVAKLADPEPKNRPPVRSYTRKRKVAQADDDQEPVQFTNGSDNNNDMNFNLKTARGEVNSRLEVAQDRDSAKEEQAAGSGGVKLVISKKKGSIFKSRALVPDTDGGAKKRHVYKHKWDDEEEGGANAGGENPEKLGKGDNSSNSRAERSKAAFDDVDGSGGSAGGPSRVSSLNAARGGENQKSRTKSKPKISMEFDEEEDDEEEEDDGTPKKVKFYKVVRNVKQAHQIQEIGEFQEMDDDVEYILDTLQPHNPISTRCLSAIQLSTKCMTPAFRMHVRAHGTVTKFFRALQDATKDQSLGLCTATIMFVLSQDNLNMDLDRDSLELMLNLLESDVSHADALDDSGMSLQQLERNKKKVRDLCEELKNQGKGAHLNLDNITVGTLAMETLLSLTSKRAGEWFKEELRNLGGLEHIIKTICECCRQISDYVAVWTEGLLEKLRKIERCLRVLENVMEMNEQNQNYILTYDNGNAINILVKLYKLCDTEIALYPTTAQTPKEHPGVVIREALVPTLKVLISLTHPFNDQALGASILGDKSEIFDTSLHLLFHSSNYVPENCIFELSLLVLLLLINLTMHTVPNRGKIMDANALNDFGSQFVKVPAIKALVEFFYKCEELARMAEKNTDALLDSKPKKTEMKNNKEDVEETVHKILQKAGNHMEHTIMASYVALLIGHLVMENGGHQKKIRTFLRVDAGFGFMAQILEKYYNFLNLTASSEASAVAHINSTKRIIDYLQKCEQSSS